MVFQAILAAIISAFDIIGFRYMLTSKHMSWQKFNTLTFAGIFFVLLPFTPLFFEVNSKMFSWFYIALITALVITATVRGFLHFNGLKHTAVENAEPLGLSSWIFTVILALVFFPSERNTVDVVLALVAATTIIWLKIEKHHLVLDKYAKYILIGAFLWSIHAILLNFLLEVYSPLMLVFVRAGIITIILVMIFKVEKKDFKHHMFWWLLLVSSLDAIHWWLVLWSYTSIGIISTSLIMTSVPIIAEWLAKFFLKEKLHWKNIVATIVICLCICVSILV